MTYLDAIDPYVDSINQAVKQADLDISNLQHLLSVAQANDATDAANIALLQAEVARLNAIVNPPPPVQPSADKRWQDIPGNPGDKLHGLEGSVSLPASLIIGGPKGFGYPSNFMRNSFYSGTIDKLLGSGVGKTILSPADMTAADLLVIPPPYDTWKITNPTNNSYVTRFDQAELHDLTIRGTKQPRSYNGHDAYKNHDLHHKNVNIESIPGTAGFPPEETANWGEYTSTGNIIYENVNIDGRDWDGNSAGAAGWSLNNCTGLYTWLGGSAKYLKNSAGQTSFNFGGSIVFNDFVSQYNWLAFNAENYKVGAKFTYNRCDFRYTVSDRDFVFDSPQASALVVINDPIFEPTKGVRIQLHKNWNGAPSKQRKQDIKVFQGGVDVTAKVVKWSGDGVL